MLADAGATVTVATGAGGAGGGAVTVMAEVLLRPSLAAVMVAEPAATPVTCPLGDTAATDALEVDHATTRSVRALPFASRGVA